MDAETDAATQRQGNFSAPRYFGARQARAERDRGLKRLRLGQALQGPQGPKQKAPAKLALPLPAFIPLQEADRKVRLCTPLYALHRIVCYVGFERS